MVRMALGMINPKTSATDNQPMCAFLSRDGLIRATDNRITADNEKTKAPKRSFQRKNHPTRARITAMVIPSRLNSPMLGVSS